MDQWRADYRAMPNVRQMMAASIAWLYGAGENNVWLRRVPCTWHATAAIACLRVAEHWKIGRVATRSIRTGSCGGQCQLIKCRGTLSRHFQNIRFEDKKRSDRAPVPAGEMFRRSAANVASAHSGREITQRTASCDTAVARGPGHGRPSCSQERSRSKSSM